MSVNIKLTTRPQADSEHTSVLFTEPALWLKEIQWISQYSAVEE